ncbi:circularly permuted type 2 ATP-grasp protein, partial [Mycobacterium tuberculosis]|nr:circularly permuted type 2 ATP-grasp protein [Mycobacterium tuberculosis]
KGVVIGPSCSKAELAAAREHIIANPRGWIAQPLIQLSTVPTMTDEGLEPRHVDLRPFIIIDGEDMWILPGGLTRVA